MVKIPLLMCRIAENPLKWYNTFTALPKVLGVSTESLQTLTVLLQLEEK